MKHVKKEDCICCNGKLLEMLIKYMDKTSLDKLPHSFAVETPDWGRLIITVEYDGKWYLK